MDAPLASISIALGFGVVGQIPPGYQIVQITDNPDDPSRDPKLNICGEIVFSTRIAMSKMFEEIFLYDNGLLTQLTDDEQRDAFADINDPGTVAYTHNADGFGGGEILLWMSEGIESLGPGFRPRLNNLGHVAWLMLDPVGCATPTDVYFFDGTVVNQITDDGLANRAVNLNDNDTLVWARYDFCLTPWESEIMRHADGKTTVLTDGRFQPQGADVNNAETVAWSHTDGETADGIVEIWQGGETTQLTDWGRGSILNNAGDILFTRCCHDEPDETQVWLHRAGEFFRITDTRMQSFPTDINDHGEIVWYSTTYPVAYIFLLRRIRTGRASAHKWVV